MNYGKELILDIHDCSGYNFDRSSLKEFFIELCDLINMERCDLHFWDYDGEPEEYDKAPAHLKGRSAVQFISTSNITIHTLDEMKRVYLNIFTCKSFDPGIVIAFCENHFDGQAVNSTMVTRI